MYVSEVFLSAAWMRVDAHDPTGNRVYIQSRTGLPLPYADWRTGEPNGNNQCVYIDTGSTGWNDELCSKLIPIICEYDVL